MQRFDLARFVSDGQRRKLLRRTRRQKGELSLRELEEVERRAANAIVELREAPRFGRVIPLHDGEGNDNWDTLYDPIGSARTALEAFGGLLEGRTPSGVECREVGLVPWPCRARGPRRDRDWGREAHGDRQTAGCPAPTAELRTTGRSSESPKQ